MNTVVTRFPPSPTGHLHIGGARTALFNWLLARSQGGRFILRIEDTDRERSDEAMTQAIIEAMHWLGLDFDEGPHRQSERGELYDRHVDKLLESGHAYWCDCTPEQVNAMRQKAQAEGKKPRYDGSCRSKGLGPGPGRVVRLKAPTGPCAWNDMVKGPMEMDFAEMVDDFVLRRPDGSAMYNLAVVVDDALMGVNHILRGEDHLSNAPKQIALYNAFGWPVPAMGHVPMIHGADNKKLSKRHGALSVMEYERLGYLPEAMVNYLLRLGWGHGDQEYFSRREMIELFTVRGLGTSAARFDPQKLDSVNAHYIRQAEPGQLAPMLGRFLEDAGRAPQDPAFLEAIVPLLQPRAKTMVEMAQAADFFAVPDAELVFDAAAVAKFLTPEARQLLGSLREVLAGAGFSQAALEEAMQSFLAGRELKFKVVAQPLRVAITGKTFSPGLYETMEVLGRERTLARLDQALALPA